MADLIERKPLYEQAAKLEAQALDYVGRLIERDGEEPSEEWRVWSAILIERTAFKHDVFDAPSAEPERKTGGWIPCSERLPEKHQMVLTTIKGVDLFRECVDKNFFEALATAKKRTWVSVGYLGDDGWYGADGFPQIVQPIAWMPVPEPYKEGEEDGRS